MAQRFGRYWLQEKIGHGGMAEIFRATIGPDEDTYAFELALKRLHAELQRDKAMVDMFLTEADIAKFLRHPNIVQVYESGVIDAEPYIAMEYVWGTDLATLTDALRRRQVRFPADLAIYTALQILRALDYVHRATTPAGQAMDLVHRDVTPSNLYITFDGQVKLGDFGVAHVGFLEERDDTQLKGKAAYIPPEVLIGAPVDRRVDLWSLSACLWEMLTSQRLHEGVPEPDIVSGAASRRIQPVSVLNPDVPGSLSSIVQRALSWKPRRRQPDAVTLYRELKFYLRDAGLVVTGAGLGRFVSGAMGSRGGERRPQASSTGVFERPAYEVPVGMSPTQRYQIVQRRRRRLGPAVALGVLAIAASVWWTGKSWWPHFHSRPTVVATPSTTVVAPPVAPPGSPEPNSPSTPAVTPTPPTDLQAPERSRPEALDFAVWDSAEALVAKGPAKFEVLMERGRNLVKHHKYAAAEASYREAQDLRPRSVTAMLGRANALIELRSYREAEQVIRAALVVDARNAYAYLLLGDVLWMSGHDKVAREAYERCIAIDPHSKTAEIARRVLAKLPR